MLRDLIAPRRRLLQQARELRALRRELASLRAQNDSMREGMRRCVSCDYRIDYKRRQGGEPDPTTAQEVSPWQSS